MYGFYFMPAPCCGWYVTDKASAGYGELGQLTLAFQEMSQIFMWLYLN